MDHQIEYEHKDKITNNLCKGIAITYNIPYVCGYDTVIIVSNISRANTTLSLNNITQQVLKDIKDNFIKYKYNSAIQKIEINEYFLDIDPYYSTIMESHIPIIVDVHNIDFMCVCVSKLLTHNKLKGLIIRSESLINEDTANILGKAIQLNTCLKKLYIRYYPKKFLTCLKYNNSIEKIHVLNDIKPLYKSLKYNRSINNVRILVHMDNIKYVIKLLHNNRITSIHLYTYDISYGIYNCILQAIKKVKHIIYLKLSNINKFSKQNLKQFIRIINKNNTIKVLDIGYINNNYTIGYIYKHFRNKVIEQINVVILFHKDIIYIINLLKKSKTLHIIKHSMPLYQETLEIYNSYGISKLKTNSRFIIKAKNLSGPILNLCNRNKHNCYQKNITLLQLISTNY